MSLLDLRSLGDLLCEGKRCSAIQKTRPDPYSSANGILMPMPEDIEIFKVVPIDEYTIFLPGAAARFLPRNKELLLRHRFSFHFLARIYSLLEPRIE